MTLEQNSSPPPVSVIGPPVLALASAGPIERGPCRSSPLPLYGSPLPRSESKPSTRPVPIARYVIVVTPLALREPPAILKPVFSYDMEGPMPGGFRQKNGGATTAAPPKLADRVFPLENRPSPVYLVWTAEMMFPCGSVSNT